MKKSTVRKDSVASRMIRGLKDFAQALENGEPLPGRFTCRTMTLDLEPEAYDPAKVRETRKLLGASQAIFALFLGVSVKTVHAWEQGRSTPEGIARRFMDEIRRDPGYWLERLKAAVVVMKE